MPYVPETDSISSGPSGSTSGSNTVGGDGNDTLRGGGNDDVYGKAGNDKLYGTTGDYLFGGDGNDRLYSTDGTEYMTMYGGHGTQYRVMETLTCLSLVGVTDTLPLPTLKTG